MGEIDKHKLAVINYDSVDYRGDIQAEDWDDDNRHEKLMMKYGIERYGRNSIFGVFENDSNFKLVEYYLVSHGNILFYNLSGGGNKFGIFYVLDNIDENQYKQVLEFLDTLEGFTVELDSFVTFDGQLVVNDPFEESYEEDFKEIKQYFKDITIGKATKNKGF